MVAIPLAYCPLHDNTDVMAKPRDQFGVSLLHRLKHSDNVRRLDIGHPKRSQLRIDVSLKHPPPLILHNCGTLPVRSARPDNLLDSLCERRYRGGTPVDERVDTVGDECPNSQRAFARLPEAHVRIPPMTKRTAATIERGDALFPAFSTAW